MGNIIKYINHTNMKYSLIHQDSSGNKTTTVEKISYLAFIKHATFAGINTKFFPQLPFRYLSILFEFAPHFWTGNCFQQLPQLSSDPTETGYISNKIGRAFSDYLSKKYTEQDSHTVTSAQWHYKVTHSLGKGPIFTATL